MICEYATSSLMDEAIRSNIDTPQSQELAQAGSLTSIARAFSMDVDCL
jgi:hypothetical protein